MIRIDPKHAFKMGPVNGRRGQEATVAATGEVPHNRSFADGGNWSDDHAAVARLASAGAGPSGWSISVSPGPIIGAYDEP